MEATPILVVQGVLETLAKVVLPLIPSPEAHLSNLYALHVPLAGQGFFGCQAGMSSQLFDHTTLRGIHGEDAIHEMLSAWGFISLGSTK